MLLQIGLIPAQFFFSGRLIRALFTMRKEAKKSAIYEHPLLVAVRALLIEMNGAYA
jgi:hypothetical protein